MAGQRTAPQHVAIIMDGAGRWAQARGRPRSEGHARGIEVTHAVVESAAELGVEYLTLYTFSLASWDRPKEEIASLMSLLEGYAAEGERRYKDRGIFVDVVGQFDELHTPARHAIERLRTATKDNKGMRLTLALSYGGRRDIVEAAQALAARARSGLVLPEEIDESFFHAAMTTSSLPPVDLLIRTGGENRLSDFMLFECAYAELMFLPIMWPEFSPDTLKEVLAQFDAVERRFGRTSEQVGGAGFDPPDAQH